MSKIYSSSDVASHNSKQDCWVILNNQVLDVTHFLKDHPGGELSIVNFAGKDATEEFNMIHPEGVISKYAPDTIIGKLDPEDANKEKPAASKPASGGSSGGCFAFLGSICGK